MIYPWNNSLSLGVLPHVLALLDKGEKEILEIIKLVAGDLFFDNIEISEIKDEKIRKEVKKVIEISYLDTIFNVGYVIFRENLDLNSLDRNIQKKAINRVIELIDMAYFFEAKKFVITSGLDVEPNKRQEAKRILVESLAEICQCLKSQKDKLGKPIDMVLETFDREYTHKLLVGPTSEAVEIVTKIRGDYENIGLMLDIGHLPLLGEGISDAITKAGNYLKHVHIGNCVLKNQNDPRFGDTHPYLGYPGGENGVEQVSLFLKSLKDNNYFDIDIVLKDKELPTVNFEIIRKPKDDVKILIANIERVFTKAWELASFK